MLRKLILWVLPIVLGACGDKDSNDDAGSGSQETTGSLILKENPTASVVPVEVNLNSPTQNDGTALDVGSLVIEGASLVSSTSGFAQLVEARLQKIVSGKNCTPDFEATTVTQPVCYNQVVTADGASGSRTSELIHFPSSLSAQAIDGADPDSPTAQRVLDDTSGIIASLEGDEATCVATMDQDGEPCEWCSLNGVDLCLNGEQAEIVEQVGGSCDTAAAESFYAQTY